MSQPVSHMTDASTAKCVLAGEALRSFGTLNFPSVGRSMLPTVWPGDTLVVEHVVPDQVRIGDVVVVGREGKLCAHRVTGKAGDPKNPQWITQGDALPVPDRPVAKNELMGRVTYLIREGRLVPVPAELSGIDKVIAKVVRRSGSAARALVFLNRKRQTSKKSAMPCQS